MDREHANPADPGDAREIVIDWARARRFLARCLRRRLARATKAEIEDLTQESLIRLLRAARREPIHNLDGLMTDIARKTAFDSQRMKTRWRAILEGSDHHMAESATSDTPLPDVLGDPLERARFVILEFLGRRSSACHQLAVQYFQGEGSWSAVALQLGKTPEAVRQQWSRCVALLRKEARRNPDFLSEWARDED